MGDRSLTVGLAPGAVDTETALPGRRPCHAALPRDPAVQPHRRGQVVRRMLAVSASPRNSGDAEAGATAAFRRCPASSPPGRYAAHRPAWPPRATAAWTARSGSVPAWTRSCPAFRTRRSSSAGQAGRRRRCQGRDSCRRDAFSRISLLTSKCALRMGLPMSSPPPHSWIACSMRCAHSPAVQLPVCGADFRSGCTASRSMSAVACLEPISLGHVTK